MKTRSMLIGFAMAAALNCAAVNAQVLGGGSIGGGLGGGLGGGMRDMSVLTQGSANCSLGAGIETDSLRRTTRGVADRTTDRARNTTTAVRDRAAAKVEQTRDTTSNTASAAAASAAGAINGVQIEGAADVAGSAASNVGSNGLQLAGNAQGAASGAANGGALPTAPELSKPEVSKPEGTQEQPTQLIGKDAPTAPSTTQGTSEPAKTTEPRGLNLTGDANGSASASKEGMSAGGSGSANVSRK